MAQAFFSALINQWPALAGLAAIALAFWKLFEKHLEENRSLLSETRKLIGEYKLLSDHKVEEIERLRIQFMAVLKDNQRASKKYDDMNKRYDDIKTEFSNLLLENRGLKRMLDSIEEMLRATGGDVKVISTQIRKAQEDIDSVSYKMNLLESGDRS